MRPAKAGMRLAAQRFDIAMRAINEGVYDWNIAKGTIYYSDGVYRAVGMSPGDFKTPADWRNRIHPEDVANFDAALVAHFKRKTERFECDYRFRSKDGTWRWARQHGVAMLDKRGRAVRMIGSTGDITELKRAERALKESEERYDTAMRAINEGVYDYDIANDAIYYSDRIYEVLDASRDLLRTAADWRRLIHPDDLPGYIAAYAAHMKGESARFALDYRYRARDGALRWARQHGLALRDGNGRAVRVIGSVGDITELKRTEEALRRSEERYALATRAATEGIYEWNVETAALFVSDRAREVFGLPHPPLTRTDWVERIHPDDIEGYRRAIIDHFKGHSSELEHEYRVRDAAGGYRWVLDRGRAVRDAEGRATRLIGAESDVTQRKLAEIELRRARDAATETLEQQTATAEILRVISSTPTDTQPVFEAIVRSALRLFDGMGVGIVLVDGDRIQLAAGGGPMVSEHPSWRASFPMPLTRDSASGRSILDRGVVDIGDIEAPEAPLFARESGRLLGYRAIASAPMLREGVAVGAIGVMRRESGAFGEKQLALLKTFADQAVIAIENVRLFNETKEALERQTATAEILRVISQSPSDVQPVFNAIVESGLHLFGGQDVVLRLVKGDQTEMVASTLSRRGAPIPPPIPVSDEGSPAHRAIQRREVVQVPDIAAANWVSESTKRRTAGRGVRAIVSAPMLRENEPIGAISVTRTTPGPFTEKQIALLKTFAAQAVIAIENVRLFNEIQDKSAQLEVASRHKSEFLANMSHELRTPLNAVIGFSEVLGERLFGELNDKQGEYVKDIHASGTHLLSLINDILDLSKIEAGRMELELADFELRPALENAITLIKERAQRHGIRLGLEIDPALGTVQADERKFKQVMLNLLSNAVKFTPEGGSVSVRAKLNGALMEVAVSDTGAGIAPEDQAAAFEEFKQVGRDSARKAEGTGLGLPLTKKIIELHGGAIRLESAPGKGSTFTFTIPLAQR